MTVRRGGGLILKEIERSRRRHAGSCYVAGLPMSCPYMKVYDVTIDVESMQCVVFVAVCDDDNMILSRCPMPLLAAGPCNRVTPYF